MGQEIPQLSLRAAFLCTIAVPVAVAASPVRAQEANDSVQASEAASAFDIVVTAQKREQLLQDVPVAVSVVTQESLQANRIVNIRDLDGLTPGLSVRKQSGGNALSSFSMRGILTSGDAPARDRGIGMYIDGVYIGNAFGSIFEMPNIDHIEVLRGPQGTLFGRNTTGGAISIVTREPSGTFGIKETATVGNYAQRRTATTISSPQVGPFSAMVSYVHSQRRGDIRNLGAGTQWDLSRAFGKPTIVVSPKYLGDDNSDSLFFAAKGDFDQLKLVYRFDYTHDRSSESGEGVSYEAPSIRAMIATQPNQALMTPISSTRPDAVNNWAVAPSHIKVYGQSLTATYRVNDVLTLKDIAGFRFTRSISPSQDVDGIGGLFNTGAAFFRSFVTPAAAAAQVGAPFLLQQSGVDFAAKQWTNEFQVNLDTRWATVTGGLMYYRQSANYGQSGEASQFGYARSSSFVVLPGFQSTSTVQPQNQAGRASNVVSRSYAAYAQAEWHVYHGLDVVTGIRYTKDRKKGIDRTVVSITNSNTFPIEYSGERPTYTAGVNYKPTEDILVYGKYTTGFISGGNTSTVTFAPETAKSWEGGIKADWLGKALRANLAVYSVGYANLQAGPLVRNVPALAYLVPLGVSTISLNIGAARVKGFELETTYSPIRDLILSASVADASFKYTSLSPVITTGIAGYQVNNRPKWTASLSAQYTSPDLFDEVHLTARVDGNWRSRQNGSSNIPLPGGAISGGAAFTPAEVAAYMQGSTIKPYWLVNGRVALDGFRFGQVKGSVALWSRNLFNDKSMTFPIGLSYADSALYEPARTVGLDVTVEY